MGPLLILAFVLSLDSFRVSLGLGAAKLRTARLIQIVLAFGLCDALAPLVGVLIGGTVLKYVGEWTEHLGAVLLCGYGIYVIYQAQRCAGKGDDENDRWIVLGLPLTMSLDNLVAGTSLGMVGFPLVVSVIVFGVMSALMSLAGLLVARTAVNFLKLKSELWAGVAIVLIALSLELKNL